MIAIEKKTDRQIFFFFFFILQCVIICMNVAVFGISYFFIVLFDVDEAGKKRL